MLLGTRSKILHQHSKQKAALVYREGPIIGEVRGSKNIREWTRCMLKTGAIGVDDTWSADNQIFPVYV